MSHNFEDTSSMVNEPHVQRYMGVFHPHTEYLASRIREEHAFVDR